MKKFWNWVRNEGGERMEYHKDSGQRGVEWHKDHAFYHMEQCRFGL